MVHQRNRRCSVRSYRMGTLRELSCISSRTATRLTWDISAKMRQSSLATIPMFMSDS